MKIFCVLLIFISLALAGLGAYLIIQSAADPSNLAIAKIVLGGILAFIGAGLTVAVVYVKVSERVTKNRMKKGGKK